ncbi:MAG: exo-alpha-sialidase [Bacteroidales bacterium]|nr:exo-alpha-sialidase [Bacteroidales bacterium]
MKIKFSWFIAFTWLLGSFLQAQNNDKKAFVCDEFLYDTAVFASCHASTIVQTDEGDLLAAYFGGSYEGCDDVCIWLSRKKYGTNTWLSPVKIADGNPYGELKEKKACYNPVLYKFPQNGKLVLFFKIGKNVQDWTGWYSVSEDNGYTWSNKQMLPEGYLGPIKNKPELINNKLICPSSTEKGGWKIHFEIFDLDKNAWQYVGPVKAARAISTMNMPKGEKEPIICIQPSILKLPDGRLTVLCRTKNGRLAQSFSKDGGMSWTKVKLTDLPNNNSGTDAVTLKDGRHVLVCNDIATKDGQEMGARSPLSLLVFDKDMKTVLKRIVLEDEKDAEFSYPAVIQGKNGNLHITYTWKRKRIAYKEIDLNLLD